MCLSQYAKTVQYTFKNSDSHTVLSLSQSRIREILYTIKNRSVIGESRISPDNRRNVVCVTWGLIWGELVGYLEKTWKYLEILGEDFSTTWMKLGGRFRATLGPLIDHKTKCRRIMESHDVRQCHAWVKHHKLASLGVSNFRTFW